MAEARKKFNRPADEGDEVEGHKFEPTEAKREKFQAPADEGGDAVEGHKFEPTEAKREKFNDAGGEVDDVEAHKL